MRPARLALVLALLAPLLESATQQNAKNYYDRALAQLDQGRVDEAIASLRQAIELQPDMVEAHSSLGRALHAKGELDEAIASYRKAIEVDARPPGSGWGPGGEASWWMTFHHFQLVVALVEGGEGVGGGIGAPLNLIESQPGPAQPDLAAVHNDLGRALHAQGDFAEASDSFLTAIELQPDLGIAYNNLGRALQDLGRPRCLDEAIASYRKAIE